MAIASTSFEGLDGSSILSDDFKENVDPEAFWCSGDAIDLMIFVGEACAERLN